MCRRAAAPGAAWDPRQQVGMLAVWEACALPTARRRCCRQLGLAVPTACTGAAALQRLLPAPPVSGTLRRCAASLAPVQMQRMGHGGRAVTLSMTTIT